jgi:hypothetical protein
MALEWTRSSLKQCKLHLLDCADVQGAEIGAFLRSDEVPGAKSMVPSKLVNASGPNAPDLELISSTSSYTCVDPAHKLMASTCALHEVSLPYI